MTARVATWGRTAALGLLALLLASSSFYYGAVETWAGAWLRLGALLTVTVIAWTAAPAEMIRRPVGRVVLPLALFLGWAWLQTVPLPAGVLRAVSPRAAGIYADTVPEGAGAGLPRWLFRRAEGDGVRLGSEAGMPAASDDRGDPALGRSLSLHPGGTREAIDAWLAPILIFLAAAWIADRPSGRWRLLWAIAAVAGAWGLVGLLQQLGWDGRPLWVREAPLGGDRPTLPFINRNHYAGFQAMGGLAALGLAVAILVRPSGRLTRGTVHAALSDLTWTVPRLIAAGVCAALGVGSVLLSGSRGGLLGLTAGLVFFAVAHRLKGWMAWAFVVVALAGLLAGVPALGSAETEALERAPFLSSGGDASGLVRVDAWAKTLRLFMDFPLTGIGLGAFPWGFSMVQRQGEWLMFLEAHNDYVQVLAETGLVGIGLLGWALGAFLHGSVRPALRGPGAGPRFTSVGVAAALFALAVHSIVDFNLQIPSNAALFAGLAGVLAAAARDERPPAEATR